MKFYPRFFLWTFTSITLGVFFLSLIFLDQETYILLATEGAYTELATAILYLGSGALLLISAKKIYGLEKSVRAIIFVFMLGLFFIFIAGEEESWGQWIFSFETPAEYAKRNAQGEVNLHNLNIFAESSFLNPHRILKLFVLTFSVFIPIACATFGSVRKKLISLNFPLVPLEIVPMFLMAIFYEEISHYFLSHWANSEFMEFFFSIGFFAFSLSYFASSSARYKGAEG